MPQLTFTDKILAKTVLPLIPRFVTPNAVTWLRFLSIPFVGYFLWDGDYKIGLPLFLLSAFTDALDGSLARTRNMITEWGKTFDPVADKILIGTAIFILSSRYISPYLAATVIGIEFFIVVSAYYRKRAFGVPIEAEISGKIKMTLQSLGVGSILAGIVFQTAEFFAIATYLIYLAIIFAIISLVVYKSI